MAGTVRVKAIDRRFARILGLNNSFLVKAIEGFHHREMVEAGGQWQAWRHLHRTANEAPGYIFDSAKRDCWACVVQVGETNDITWEDDTPV